MKKMMMGFLVAAMTGGPVFAASTVTRSMGSTNYTPGQDVTVTITVTPDAAVKAYGLEENPPDNWAITNISDNGSAVSGIIKWGVFLDAQSRTLTYTLTPPSNETGTKSFAGVASFDGVSLNIGGTAGLYPVASAGASTVTDTQFLPFKNVFNPTKETLTIKYTVAGSAVGSSSVKSAAVYGSSGGSDASLTIYDHSGAEVRKLERNGTQAIWDGRNSQGTMVASGTYLVVLKQGSKIVKKKLVVVK